MSGITSVEIERFRCFERLRVDGLTPVSLVVGKNNSGKTALLEAIEAVVSEDNPFALYRASFERGEFRRRKAADEDRLDLDVSHWFHGHRIDIGDAFSIRAVGGRERRFECGVEMPPAGTPSALQALLPSRWLALTPSGSSEAGQGRRQSFPLTFDGFLGAPAHWEFAEFGHRLQPPVGFITTDCPVAAEFGRLWAGVVLTPAEDRTIDALRIVDSRIERIAISEGDGGASAKVLLRGAQAPVPLGTLGEGVSRVLTLALHLSVVQGGFLFVDEIENGLHWSVMPSIWRFLVETARALDVQVFATTHSKDCLEGLAELRRTHPALAESVSVHRLDAGRETSVRFNADRIAEYVDMALEPR